MIADRISVQSTATRFGLQNIIKRACKWYFGNCTCYTAQNVWVCMLHYVIELHNAVWSKKYAGQWAKARAQHIFGSSRNSKMCKNSKLTGVALKHWENAWRTLVMREGGGYRHCVQLGAPKGRPRERRRHAKRCAWVNSHLVCLCLLQLTSTWTRAGASCGWSAPFKNDGAKTAEGDAAGCQVQVPAQELQVVPDVCHLPSL